MTAQDADTADALAPVAGPMVWAGPAMARRPEAWTCQLDEAQRAELLRAVAGVAGRDILAIGAANFPLPELGPALADIRREVLHGKGFALIRGAPVAALSVAGIARLFWGLGAHLGEAVSQNGKGHVLGHVKNLGLDYADPLTRGYQTNARLPFHTDSSDLVCLLSLQAAQSGGLSSIVSSSAVYNAMLERAPDLAALLTRPVHRTRWGEIPEGRKPWSEIPVFNPWRGRVITTYVRSAIRKAQTIPGAPPLTARHEAAFDMIDALAAGDALRLDMEFRVGDIQILNNHAILHSRTAYTDHADPAQRRHLLRLWLACDDGPDLPPTMTNDYQGMTESGRPNGICVPGVPFCAPLEAD